MNPALPLDCFVPDSEAHVMPDGRLYVYGSWDIKDNNAYCSDRYHVFSTDDLIHWTDHGESYAEEGNLLYAPDCACRSGKYYLYICKSGGAEEVAVSDNPYGPFTDARPLNFADGRGIDPSVFIDDDGQAYYFFGQFSLMGAKLNDDMRTLDESSIVYDILTEEIHGFHEGSSIRKIGDTYYLVYTDIARGKATCLSYATSSSPLGPYTKRGTLIDNTYCDPDTWNNHGSMEMFNGELWLFYHRSSRNSNFNRRLCVEKLQLNPDGTIDEAEMTSQGAGGPLDAFDYTEASRACRMRCGGYTVTDDVLHERLTNCGGSRAWPGFIEYKYLGFSKDAERFDIEARGIGKIRICVGGRDGQSEITADSADSFRTYTADVSVKRGVYPLWLLIEGSGIEIRKFRFI